MKNIGIWLAGAAAVTGIIAAFLWWFSTGIDQSFEPAPPTGDVAKDTPDGKVIKGYLMDLYNNLTKFSDASKAVARLNKWAAIFTAISVALSGLSSFASQSN